MPVKVVRKITNGKGVSAYRFTVRKDAEQDDRVYQLGLEIEKKVGKRAGSPPAKTQPSPKQTP